MGWNPGFAPDPSRRRPRRRLKSDTSKASSLEAQGGPWRITAKDVKGEYKTTKKTMKQQYKDGDITKPYYKEVLFFYLHKTRHTGADMKAFMAVRVSIPGSP